MSPIHTRIAAWCTKLLFGIALMAFALSSSQPAAAAFRGCRTDPAIVLSNGLVLQADVTYETLPMHVAGVNYLVHLPKQGVKVMAVVKDPVMGAKERVSFVYDQPAGQYSIDTEVFVTKAAINTEYEAASRLVLGSKTLQQQYYIGKFKTVSSGIFSHKFFG